MSTIPHITIEAPGDVLTKEHGFKYFWAKHVSGFNGAEHCLKCLVGPRESRVKFGMPLSRRIPMIDGRAPFIYICGGAGTATRLGRWVDNLHIAGRPMPGACIQRVTYNGVRVIVDNVEEVEISGLPDGFRELPKSFTTCRNFQFGVRHFE